jgi:hypothetical protein
VEVVHYWAFRQLTTDAKIVAGIILFPRTFHLVSPTALAGSLMGGRPSAGNPIDRIGGGVYDDGSQPGCLHAADPSAESMASPAVGRPALAGPLLKNRS